MTLRDTRPVALLEWLEPRVLLAGTWNVLPVASNATGGAEDPRTPVVVALDAAGAAHVGYIDDAVNSAGSVVRYATFSGTAWTKVTSALLPAGTCLALAFNAQGRPRIVYETGTGELDYAAWTGTAWQTRLLESAGQMVTGAALVLDAAGNPRIAYTTVLGGLTYTALAGTAWSKQTLATLATGTPSLALDAGGAPHIAYNGDLDGDLATELVYAAWTGAVWAQEAVGTVGFGGDYVSLALDGSGNPGICYSGQNNLFLEYASSNGIVWTTQAVDAPGAAQSDNALAFDAGDNPHIVYVAGPGTSLNMVRHAAWNGTFWDVDTLSTTAAGGLAMGFARNGVLHAAYFDQQGTATYLRCGRQTLDPANTTRVLVQGNGRTIADGSQAVNVADGTLLQQFVQGDPAPERTFTVYNIGSVALTLGVPKVPKGFTITKALARTIPAGGSDTLTVQMSTATLGVFQGDITFTTNDADRTPFNFKICGWVNKAPNHAPSFTKGADVTVSEDAAAQSIATWATAISTGSPFEAGQALTFLAANDNHALFKVQPAISAAGALTFTPALDQTGAATVTVTLKDNGGTDNGGVDTSAPQTFTITVNPVNDPPAADTQTVSTVAGSVEVVLTGSDLQTPPADLTYAVDTGPSHGTLTPLAPDRYRYDADPGFTGVDRFTFTVGDNGDPAGSHANPGDLASLPAPVNVLVGATVHLASGRTVTYIDSNLQTVSVTLSGPGAADLVFAAAQPAPGDLSAILLDRTAATSSLTFRTPAGVVTAIGGVVVSGSLATLAAGPTHLAGDLTVDGTAGRLTLGDVDGGATIRIGGSPTTRTAATLKFRRVADTSIDCGMPITSITAMEWLDTDVNPDEIKAPRLGTLTVNGGVPRTVAGDFEANLTLSGAGVTGSTKTLTRATVKGSLGPSTWDVTGKVGTVTVSGTVGDLGQPWQLTGATALATLALGDVVEASVTVGGDIGTVKSQRWQAGSIQAARITSIAATGLAATTTAPAIPGDWGADVTLTNALAKPALGRLTVAGWLDWATVTSAGPLGTLTVGGLRASTIAAGDLTGVPATQMALGSLTVKGIAGQTELVLGSNVSAWKLGTVRLRGVKMGNSGAPFGVQGHTLASYTRYTGTVIARRATHLTGPLGVPVDADTDFSVTLV